MTGLRDLDLNYGRFTDKGLGLLAKLPRLERLEMSNARMTDKGIESLAAAKEPGVAHIDAAQIERGRLGSLTRCWRPSSLTSEYERRLCER